MNDNETHEALLFAAQLWPAWKPDDADRDAWTRLLARIVSVGAARDAMRRLKDTTDWTTPKRAQFLALLPRQTGSPRGQQDPEAEAHPGYVQCVEGPRAGWFVPLAYPGDVPPEYIQHGHLQRMLDDYTATYGGKWQIVSDPYRPRIPVTEIMTAMHRLRGTMPFDEQRACKKPKAEYRGTPTRENSRAVPVRQTVADFMAGIGPQTGTP